MRAAVRTLEQPKRVIWLDTGNVETYDREADAVARVAELRKRGYEVCTDRSGDFVVP